MSERLNTKDVTRLLLDAYLKVLKINLSDDSFDEIKVKNDELDISHGYSNKISEWLIGFAKAGNVYKDDLDAYLDFVDINNLINEFSSGKDSVSIRYRRQNEGQFRWAKMTLRKSYDYREDNKVLTLYIEDINDDILAAQKIHEQKDIMDALVDMYFTCLFIDMNNNTYKKVYISDEYKKYIPDSGNMHDAVSAFTNKLVIPEEKEKFVESFSVEKIREVLAKDNSYDYEYKAKTEDKEIWCRIGAILVDRNNDNSPHHIIIVMQDITTQAETIAHTNEILKEAFNTANAANSAKSDFMSRMSHDIRTPLNGIIGMTAIAGAHIDDKEKINDCLSKITSASKHLLSLINDILDVSKIESGKLSLQDEEFNLPEMLDNLIMMVHPQIEERGHDLSVSVKDVKHENVIGDNVRLNQVFLNLISNAIKYTPNGGKIKISLEELNSNSANVGMFKFVCEDNGYGMSKAFMDKLFDPFERASDERISKTQGTGLGMTITKNIVNLMGGDIKVESKENVGSKFTVTFKIKIQNEDKLKTEDLLDLSVLVVDDDEAICESTCLSLDELGMKPEYSLNGFDAIDKVVKHHNDNEDYFACLIDWKMPEIDGIETTRRIRKAVGPDVPIIIISAYEWADIEKEAKEAGADGFIAKPLFKSRLHAAFVELPKTLKEDKVNNELKDYSKVDYSDKHLLLVEDNELNREIANEMLNMTNINVDCAENGKVALDKFNNSKENYYDIILMDIRMPIMDGYEATKAIRSLNRQDSKNVPIVALTADAFLEDVSHALNVGMNEHLAKPIDPNKLLDILNKYLK